jgi:hypothetical protein
VKVEGVLAGTLNLESPFPDNYVAFLPLVVALAGAVGRTLADSRAEIEGDVLDRTAQALARKHEYSGVLTSMQENLQMVSPESLKTELTDKAKRLRTAIQDLREPQEPAKTPARSLWELIQDALNRAQQDTAMEVPSADIFHLPITPRATQAVGTLLDSIFRNVNYHSTSDGRDQNGRPMPCIVFGTTMLDGVEQALIVMENLSKRILVPEACAELYRYPVEGPLRELRLGTYIAGLNARRIGASIHATPVQGGRVFRTTLIIPIGSLSDRAISGSVPNPGS